MSKSALFIVNKFSGKGFSPEVEEKIIEKCRALTIESRIEFTQKPGHATELAQWAVDQKMTCVFAVGGDGTVNEVAQGLIHTPVAMGILPKGSGNGLARHLNIPMSFKYSLNTIGHHHVEMIDTMTINNKLSVNVSGIGFDGHVASLFAGKVKRGLMGYATLVLKEFTTFRPFEAWVETDQESFSATSFIIAIANSSQFGNNARVAPLASVKDHLMDFSFIQKVPLSQAIGFTQKMFSGKLMNSSLVKMKQVPKAKIELKEPVAFHIDGEPMPAARTFECTINSLSLKILLPEANENNTYRI
ncbi:MAG: Transcription regulator [contains diacylglycerol kinase catalytic domain] [Cytophagales bacterium]|jgi:YegS/Rv2252/BmrU family lipid kinase|nr:YegS/Rv2252/BmrU family lipid kinase [Bacteroidota bacterium]MBS1981990.1 YegS/Rv2252/BmrU family lipid kinase [Bacteroidota bacterium]WHZ09443.1 MAG: Transcription regulator [contains diacylglycerol kinase catalytic domain] [Cytophagales bacterium]